MNALSLSGLTSMMASDVMGVLRILSSRMRQGSPCADEPCHQFDVRRVTKLIDRRHALDAIAAIDQNARISGERRGIARDRHHDRDFAGGESLYLRLRALPRRIEYHGIVVAQF